MKTEHFAALSPRKILIFSTGSLGDTLLVVPAIRALRQQYPRSELVLLSDVQAGSHYLLAQDVLTGTGLIDRTVTYVVHRGQFAALANLAQRLVLVARLRRRRFDTLAYCVEVNRGDLRVARDRLFFRLAGIRRFIGMEGLEPRPTATGLAIETVVNRADELLHRFAAAGIPVPSAGEGVLDLNLGNADQAAFERWRTGLPPDGGRPWVGIGPGSKMPAKVWPAERFAALGRQLVNRFDVWPVVFGGPEDAALGARLVESWGRGYIAAGALGIRDAAVALGRCRFYVGNDTGTMHLAAAAGTPCVAIFSAREPAGRWHPYGPGHRTLRVAIECAGCCLTTCAERQNHCLTRISVDDVFATCVEVLTPDWRNLEETC
jgi:heptosyltransferase III